MGKTYNKAKPIPIIRIPPKKDHIPVSNSGKSVRSNTKKPRPITEKPMMFLFLDVIGSIIVISCRHPLYVLYSVPLRNWINLLMNFDLRVLEKKDDCLHFINPLLDKTSLWVHGKGIYNIWQRIQGN